MKFRRISTARCRILSDEYIVLYLELFVKGESKISYIFFLGDVQLPVSPSRMDIKIRNKNRTANLINEGEINILKTSGLTDISFDALLPNNNYPFANFSGSLKEAAYDWLVDKITRGSFSTAYKDAQTYLDKIEKLKTKKEPFYFIVTRMKPNFEMLFNTSMLVSLENYTIQEDAKNLGFDVMVRINLRRYVPYGTKTVTITTDENGQQHTTVTSNRPAYGKDLTTPIKIMQEQSIWEAVKKAGNGSLDWKQIANMNGVLNPSSIPNAGTQISVLNKGSMQGGLIPGTVLS